MISTDEKAGDLICPLLAIASGKQTRCQGPGCAFWRWYAGPGVGFEEYCTSTTERVGGCGLLGNPQSQHILLAMRKERPRTARTLGDNPFDVAQLNTIPPSPDDPGF